MGNDKLGRDTVAAENGFSLSSLENLSSEQGDHAFPKSIFYDFSKTFP